MTVVYLAAWGGLMFSADGVFWDDWVFVGGSPARTIEVTRELGLPWIGMLFNLFVYLGPAAYHLLSLALFLATGLFVFGILGRVPHTTQSERLFVAALVLALPVMAARNVLSVQHYAASLTLFFLGWWLLVRVEAPGRLVTAAAALLFAASFTTQSLLVFYTLPMLHLAYCARARGFSPRLFVLKYWPLIALPVVWYLVKSRLFPPSGVYAGYNTITIESLVRPALLLLVSTLPFLALYRLRRRLRPEPLRIFVTLSAGIFVTILGAFPYLAVRENQSFTEWASRNELLLPLGIALIALGICRIAGAALGRPGTFVVAAALLTLSIGLSANICAGYYVDWQKQQSLIDLMRANPALARASTAVFRDGTRDLNIFGRSYRFYEWNGLMRRAFGNEARFGVNDDPVEIAALLDGSYMRGAALYGPSSYQPSGQVVRVAIEYADASEAQLASRPWLTVALAGNRSLWLEVTLTTFRAIIPPPS